ncbi:MAG: pyridoxamine 5-phosphate oxidase-related FMN-binding protein [Candidatus Saccharibacteria bacterium]|nr:pyridoxamine 5-phosphate oxidase-related FMN-binding protein [Candidatus Saccharibacteria bacterium]
MNSVEKVKYLIENNVFMVIATADSTGKPWISPVGFTYDDSYNLYWVSYKEALHSKNIISRPEVAITIFGQMPDKSYDGVYIDATATELDNEAEIQIAIDEFAKRSQDSKFTVESIADVTDNAAWRMYKAVSVHISKRADDTINGQAITIREPVEF